MENPEKSVIDLWLAVNLAQQSIAAQAEAALKSANLPPLSWFEVLFELEMAPDGLRPFELQENLLFKQSNTSRLLQKMVADGVVAEARAPKDGRGKTMVVTPAGKKISRAMWRAYSPVLHSAHEKIKKQMDPDQVTEALRLLVDQMQLDHFEVT